jgi:hypothetical protein
VQVTADNANRRAGQVLILHVRISNLTQTDIPGVYVDLGGDWTTTAVIAIVPNGKLHDDPSGRWFVCQLQIPHGEARGLDVKTVPWRTGDAEYVFSIRALSADELQRLS